MSKKRDRENQTGSDAGPDPSSAEPLLFQLPSSDTSNNDSTKLAAKRRKILSPATLEGKNSNDDSSNNNVGAGDVGEEDGLAPSLTPTKETYGDRHPAAIAPSSALRHCDGLDIVRKGSRVRGRQLMVLPGVLGVGSGGAGGRLGTLKNATSACPVLYIEFPEVGLRVAVGTEFDDKTLAFDI